MLKNDFATDGRAYAGLQMLVWGETLGALNELSQEVAVRGAQARQSYIEMLDAVREGLDRLNTEFQGFIGRDVADRMTSIVGSLRHDMQEDASENRVLHGVTRSQVETNRGPAYGPSRTHPRFAASVLTPPRVNDRPAEIQLGEAAAAQSSIPPTAGSTRQ